MYCFCLSSHQGSTTKGKNLLPQGSKFLPLIVDPNPNIYLIHRMQTGIDASYVNYLLKRGSEVGEGEGV